MLIDAEPSFVTDLSDFVATDGGGAAVMAKDKAVKAAGGAEAATAGDIGERQSGEAQKVFDEAQAVGCAEVMAWLAC